MISNNQKISLVFLAFLLCFVFSCKEDQPEIVVAEESIANEAAVPREASNFTLNNYDGNSVSLSDYKDKIVVLEWLNYNCPFSIRHHEQGNMKSLAEKYSGDDVVWLAINSTHNQTNEGNKEFAVKYDIEYPILNDSSGDVGKSYDARTTPHMFVINKDGMIVYDGAIDDSPKDGEQEDITNYIDKALKQLLAGKEISEPRTESYGCTVKYGE